MHRSTGKLTVMLAAVALVAGLAAIALAISYKENGARAVLLPDSVISLLPESKPLTAFTLTDHDGHPFDLARLRGKWTFLFFGYAYCPDVCPTTLAQLAQARNKIAKQGSADLETQFVFVSVDPNRDTPTKLKQYVGHFDAKFVGVTGADRQIANLAGQLGARYQVTIEPGSDNYPVDHTPAVYLVDPRVRFHAIFRPPYDPALISARFELVRRLDAERNAG
ncbi:MAG TPA: SCO family protein [Burkholderiales bacterium]